MLLFHRLNIVEWSKIWKEQDKENEKEKTGGVLRVVWIYSFSALENSITASHVIPSCHLNLKHGLETQA